VTSAQEGAADQTRFEPDLGIVRLSRRQLQVLAELAIDDRAETAHAGVVQGLRTLGAYDGRSPHPVLLSLLRVIGSSRCRLWVRQWSRRRTRVVELVCGPTGIVVLPDGVDDDAPQDVRFEADAGGLAAVLAAVLDLSATPSVPDVPDGEITWDEVRSIASADPPGWAQPLLGAGAGVVHDVRWRWTDGHDDWSILVLAHLGDAGWALVRDGSPASNEPGPRCRLVPGRPDEIWPALCGLALMALTGQEPA
jgi:hypothetical protein